MEGFFYFKKFRIYSKENNKNLYIYQMSIENSDNFFVTSEESALVESSLFFLFFFSFLS